MRSPSWCTVFRVDVDKEEVRKGEQTMVDLEELLNEETETAQTYKQQYEEAIIEMEKSRNHRNVLQDQQSANQQRCD